MGEIMAAKKHTIMSKNENKNVSVNRVKVSGNLCNDAMVSAEGKFAGFDLAHNAGRKGETMFDRIKMFSKNGSKDIQIPFEILKKGKRVLVEGYRICQKETYTDKEGVEKTVKRNYIIALSVTDYPWMQDGTNPSVNEVQVSGNLFADANKDNKLTFAGFDLAHNAGKNREVLGDKIKMFTDKEGKIEIPFDILNKGNRVLVTGYRRAKTEPYTTRDGVQAKATRTYLIATKVEAYPWNAETEEVPNAEESAVVEG